MKSKKFLVVGTGSIGSRHIKNLIDLGQTVYAYSQLKKNSYLCNKKKNILINKNLDNLMHEVDAIIVSNSTNLHLDIIKKGISNKCDLFIEKPISNNMNGIKKITNLTKNLIIEVGYQLRCHPNLIFLRKSIQDSKISNIYSYRLIMGHRIDHWRPGKDYKKLYSSKSDEGGGANFELIHQLDMAIFLFGNIKQFSSIQGKVSNFKIVGDDITQILVKHNSGIVGSIQIDMVSPIYRCEAEIVTKNFIINWSINTNKIHKILPNGNKKTIHKINKKFSRNDLFIRHMKHFIKRLNNKKIKPICSFNEGVESLQIATKIHHKR